MTTTETVAPPITVALRTKGRNTIGHETNLSRSPLWRSRGGGGSDDTVVAPMLYGHAFQQVEGQPLTTGDQRLFAHLTTTFVRSGCDRDRRVPFSLGDAANAIGLQCGGKQRKLVRASLARLRSVTIESAVRHVDGHETVLGWGLIDSYLVTTKGGGKGWIVLSEPVARLLTEGSVTFLHEPTWKAISHDDEVAGRLWSFLEAENIRREWRYPLFSPSSDGTTSSVPPIADLLMLRWAERRKVAKRIAEACAVISTHDRRYRLRVEPAKASGSWNLVCSCSQRVTASSPTGIPSEVLRAWRSAYRSQVPSPRQRSVLAELLERHTPDWVTATLTQPDDGKDPFRRLLDADRRVSDERLSAARRQETAWEGEKQRLATEAEESLAELIGRMRR